MSSGSCERGIPVLLVVLGTQLAAALTHAFVFPLSPTLQLSTAMEKTVPVPLPTLGYSSSSGAMPLLMPSLYWHQTRHHACSHCSFLETEPTTCSDLNFKLFRSSTDTGSFSTVFMASAPARQASDRGPSWDTGSMVWWQWQKVVLFFGNPLSRVSTAHVSTSVGIHWNTGNLPVPTPHKRIILPSWQPSTANSSSVRGGP